MQMSRDFIIRHSTNNLQHNFQLSSCPFKSPGPSKNTERMP